MTFEEQFPSIFKRHINVRCAECSRLSTHNEVIQESCFDKVRVREAIEKVFGDKAIPCAEPQDCGWICNEGHLCNYCRYKKDLLKELDWGEE